MVFTRSQQKAAATSSAAPNTNTPKRRQQTRPGRLQPATPPTTPLKRKRSKSSAQKSRPTKRPKKLKATVPAPSTPAATPPQFPELVTASDDVSETEEDTFFESKSFGQDTFVSEWEAFELLNKLEFLQAYPHNRGSTLCAYHFLQRAETWYLRRKPAAKKELNRIYKNGVPYDFNFSHLTLPVDEKTWQLKTLQEFKDDLVREIGAATYRLGREQSRVISITGHTPACEVGPRDEPMNCCLCADGPETWSSAEALESIPAQHRSVAPEGVDESIENWTRIRRKVNESDILGCGHESPIMILGGDYGDVVECEVCSHTQSVHARYCKPRKFALRIAGIRIPVDVSPSRMAMDSRVGHASVGGLHFIVDNCSGKEMIKFR
ncbi:hypothetical protein FDECE_12982 [Fusarium decemcellulare]|nr:hypothetical protein FDECE_12982 [Fusarium decemcellulare]